MRILLTNDDGIDSPGLGALADVLQEKHEVYVIAPRSQMSATGHGISVHAPITYTRLSAEKYMLRIAADGTPADCVKLAVLYFLKDRLPDLVISGINEGSNVGSDVIYSGTVSAALEGAYLGLPSIAVSNIDRNFTAGYGLAARLVCDNLDKLLSVGLPRYSALNINYPAEKHKGVKLVRTGINYYSDRFEEVGADALRIGGVPTADGMDDETDVVQVSRGYATVSPVTLDRNDYRTLEMLKRNVRL